MSWRKLLTRKSLFGDGKSPTKASNLSDQARKAVKDFDDALFQARVSSDELLKQLEEVRLELETFKAKRASNPLVHSFNAMASDWDPTMDPLKQPKQGLVWRDLEWERLGYQKGMSINEIRREHAKK